MSDVGREILSKNDETNKHPGHLSRINPLALLANGVSPVTDKNRSMNKLQAQQPKLAPVEHPKEAPDTRQAIDTDIDVKPILLQGEDLPAFRTDIRQIQHTCAEIVREIYDLPKRYTHDDAKLALKKLPTNFTESNQASLGTLVELLQKGGSEGFEYNSRCGMQHFYENSQGRVIDAKLKVAFPEPCKAIGKSLNDFKFQIKLAKKKFDNIEDLTEIKSHSPESSEGSGATKVYAPEKLQMIAREAWDMLNLLDKCTQPLDELSKSQLLAKPSYEIDKMINDRETQKQQEYAQQVQRRQQQDKLEKVVAGAQPFKEAIELLGPYADLAAHVRDIDLLLVKISQETDPNAGMIYQELPGYRVMPGGMQGARPGSSFVRPGAGVGTMISFQLGRAVTAPLTHLLNDGADKVYVNEQSVRNNLQQLNKAIQKVKTDLQTDCAIPELMKVERNAMYDGYQSAAKEDFRGVLSNFRVDTTNMFLVPNKSESDLEKMCEQGEKLDVAQVRRKTSELLRSAEIQALRRSYPKVLDEDQYLSNQYKIKSESGTQNNSLYGLP